MRHSAVPLSNPHEPLSGNLSPRDISPNHNTQRMTWNNDLQAADSEDAVVAVINDFLAQQDERFWTRIPGGARPESVDDARDIHRWHHDLVQALKAAKPASVELQELCVLFLRASVRLHQIDLRDPQGNMPSNDEMGCAPASRKPKFC